MIRHIQEKDLNNILEIYNDAIINTTAVYDYKPYTMEYIKSWYKQKIEGGYPVLVFEENNKVIGFATFGPFRTRPAYKYTIEHSVYVHKDYRKKGIGTKLLKKLIRIANEQEYATLVAGIDSANEESIKLHERLGFTYSGTIKKAGFKFGKWLDLVFYQLDLNGPEKPTEE
ncbi:GNAT family N-acetyltransferase [Thermolongibacillus altinsuensis]|uniref:GNAT family N-acetyltransferase n=1 Tax=Thermolongibacillus altinsuensis TaxID=575256 RepID=UPI00242A2B5D|nr:GNAT family N-acetyltransferase [Thermolongibacillus altinsuensis]GMB08235.1 N-acetyltransferase [Thermolongibacillus altinsuensis]